MRGGASKLIVTHFDRLENDQPYKHDEQAQQKELQKIFLLVNNEASCTITSNELPLLVKGVSDAYKSSTNQKIAKSYVEAILQDAASENNRDLDFQDFQSLMERIAELIHENQPQNELQAGIIDRMKLRSSKLTDEQLDELYSATTIDEILPTLNTGDILLFRGQAQVSNIIKKLTFCCFSHVAMVVRNPSAAIRKAYHIPDSETEEVFNFESNSVTKPPRPGGGVHMVTLRWKLENSILNEDPNYLLCVRRLKMPKTETRQSDNELFPDLEEFILKMAGVSFEMKKRDVVASTTVLGAVPMKEDLSSVFCTELLTATYENMGLLAQNSNPTNSVPRMFTSNQRLIGSFKVARGATHEPEIRIKSTKSLEQLQDEYQEEEREPAEPIPEKLLVEVKSGAELPSKYSFIKVSLRSQSFKTNRAKKTRFPDWNEEFTFDLMSDWNAPYEEAHLSFTAQKSGLRTPQFLGLGFVDLSAITLPFEDTIELNSQGRLHIKISLLHSSE